MGLFGPPACPMPEPARVWVHERLRWLSRRFRLDDMRKRATLIPSAEHFPVPYDGTLVGVEDIVARLCPTFAFDARPIRVALDSEPPTVADAVHWTDSQGQTWVTLNPYLIRDGATVVAAIARAVAREPGPCADHRSRGGGRGTDDRPAHGLLGARSLHGERMPSVDRLGRRTLPVLAERAAGRDLSGTVRLRARRVRVGARGAA